MAMSLGIGIGLPFGGASVPPLPPTQTISFGAKTLTGHGAHLLGYTGSGTLSITSQKDASNNNVTIWQIGQNALSWKGASATYGSAAPGSLNGPYTVVVTDGTYSSTVTINILANAFHAREMAAVAQGGRWATVTTGPDAYYTVDGAGANGTHQFRVLLQVAEGSGGPLRGDTIWCRDGTLNPGDAGGRWRYRSTWTGTGVLTIRSETVDSSVDAYGWPNRSHGFKISNMTLDSAASGDVFIPITFQDIWFEGAAGTTYATRYITNLSWGFSYNNCRAAAATNHVAPKNVQGLVVRGSQTNVASCTNCTVTDLAKAIVIVSIPAAAGGRTKSASIAGNYGFNIYEDFIHDSDGEGSVVEDNFARDFPRGDVGDHPDFYQNTTNGSVDTYAGPILRRNIGVTNNGVAAWSVQFLFQRTTTATLTGSIFEHNIGLQLYANGIYVARSNNPTVRYNTVLSLVPPAVVGDLTVPETLFILVGAGEGGVDGTFNKNVTNAIDVSPQTGTVVSTPNTLLPLQTIAEYTTAMPAWVQTGVYTVAQAKAAYTPANLAVASGGCKNPDDTYNGAIGPDGDWNTGAAY